MRESARTAAALVLVFLAAAGSALAQDLPKDPAKKDEQRAPDVAKLIAQLGAEDWETRETATQKLRELGEGITPELIDAASSSDPEVRQRARFLLGELGIETDPGRLAKIEELPNDRRGKDGKARLVAVLGLFDLGGAAVDASTLEPGDYIVYAGFQWDWNVDICARCVRITIPPRTGK
jgi:hypothetical protein